MPDRYHNLIGGERLDAAAGGLFDDGNPANKSDVLGAFPRSDYRDVDRAVEVARAGRVTWRDIPPAVRAAAMLRAAEILRAEEEVLAPLIVREGGSLLADARREVQEAVETLVESAGEATCAVAVGLPRDARGGLAFGLRVPVGVVAVIGSWRHPLSGILCQIASALVAGCAVVLKPAEDSPLVATRLAEILLEAGVQPAALGVVHGLGEEAGAPLVRHPDVALVSFSGSAEVGREVAIACAAEHKPVLVELGGRSATIVLEDADLEAALEGAVEGAMAMAGQRWGPATRIFVHRKAVREFGERLAARVLALRIGDGMSPDTDLGPLINDLHLKRAHAFTRLALKEGAKLLVGGEVLREGDHRKGFFYAPTLLGETLPGMRVARDPAFGPTAALLTVAGLEEALETAERIGVQFGLAVYTQRVDRACRAMERASARFLAINAPVPGGGFRPGATRRGDVNGLDPFVERRTITMRPGRVGRRGAGQPHGAVSPEPVGGGHPADRAGG